MEKILILILVYGLILTGIAGTFLPFLPGPPLIFLSALLYHYFIGFVHPPVRTLLPLGILTLLAMSVEWFLPLMGAKKWGSSRGGLIGAGIGFLVFTFLFPPFGGIPGVFLGALLGELLVKRKLKPSLHAGMGAVIGYGGGIILKLLFSLLMLYFLLKEILLS